METTNKKPEDGPSSSTDENTQKEDAAPEKSIEQNGEGANSETTQNSAVDVGGSEDKQTSKENAEKVDEKPVEKQSETKPSEGNASEESMGENKEPQVQKSSPKTPHKDDILPNDAEINMPPKQTLGKGKRARIPNKRYSDIILSPPSRSHKSHENGNRLEIQERDTDDDEVANLSHGTSLKTRSNTASPAAKRSKLAVDPSDPKYRKPFTYGWKRELVFRGTNDNSVKKMGDIYYYTPTGKKIRSLRELSENLKSKELTMDNFTFIKEPLGLDDPEKEIIRDAKTWNKKAGARTPKVLSPKMASPKVGTSPRAAPETPEPTRKSGRNLGNIKVKLPPSKTRSDRKSKIEEESLEVDTPPSKRAATKKSTPKVAPKSVETRPKTRGTKSNSITSEKHEDTKFMDNYLQNLSYGYNTLLYVFQYLKVQDLLRAACVCTMWRDIASHSSLWRTVRMKNSQVHSFEGLANSLKKHGTVHLDLRKMLLPTNGGDDIWPEFSKAIEKVQTLRRIELCRCPASVVEQLAVTNKDLEVINAVTIKCENMGLDLLSSLTNLKELRLKSTSGLTLSSDITSLKELTNLTHLSLTSIKDLNKMSLSVIAALKNLESLDLGECSDFPNSFGEEILVKLKNLEKLRLEKGQGNCHTCEILDAVRQMPQLEQLELVNFDIKSGFDVALGGCKNIKKLLIIPTYISQSATTNHMVLGGVLRLQNTLSHFVWGVTLELLRVTELFVDQCEDPVKKEKKDKKVVGNGDSIPVLKPVPLITDSGDSIPPATNPPEVEILPLPNLQKLLLQNLPSTRVKILKIPFHATWRQSITDTVN